MISYEYVNNRVFDALACGLPLLSEPNPGMNHLKLNGVKIIQKEESIQDVIDDFIVNYGVYKEAALNDAKNILEEHTFHKRAEQLVSLID